MYCKQCGKPYEDDNILECKNCGSKKAYGRRYCERCGALNEGEKADICKVCGNYFLNSPKTKLLALILLILLGMFGAHQFYVDNKLNGLMYIFITATSLFTSGVSLLIISVLMILDFITILINDFKDGNDRKLTKWY